MTRQQPTQGSGRAGMFAQGPGVRFGLPILALLLWCASLWLPSVDVRGGPIVNGFELLVRGWEGVGRGLYAWLANPAFIAAFIVSLFPRHARTALVIAVVALALAVSSFFAAALLRWHGTSAPAISFEPGFYVWLAAAAVLCVHGVLRVRRRHANPMRSP